MVHTHRSLHFASTTQFEIIDLSSPGQYKACRSKSSGKSSWADIYYRCVPRPGPKRTGCWIGLRTYQLLCSGSTSHDGALCEAARRVIYELHGMLPRARSDVFLKCSPTSPQNAYPRPETTSGRLMKSPHWLPEKAFRSG